MGWRWGTASRAETCPGDHHMALAIRKHCPTPAHALPDTVAHTLSYFLQDAYKGFPPTVADGIALVCPRICQQW